MSLPTPRAIKTIAREYGYVERRGESSSTLFFKDTTPNNPTLINVFYTTGGVMTKLSHPRSGYNELWRSDAYDSLASLGSIFANPRVHTGQGYRHSGDAKRGCTKCGMQKKKSEYSKNQWRKGAGNAKCTSCTQQGRHGQQNNRGGDSGKEIRPRDVAWNNINDAITCDAEGCNKTAPTVRCVCAAPAYYCSESCKRRHKRAHGEDCRDVEHIRSLAVNNGAGANVTNANSGLCNADPDVRSILRERAMITQFSGERSVDTLLLQAEYIYQEDEDWERAMELYKQAMAMGRDDSRNLDPSQLRQMCMGLGRCSYELGAYDKAISVIALAINVHRAFPQVHKYLALSHLASGNRELAITTMKQAVLYESPWSDETVRANKELLCELMIGKDLHRPPVDQPRIDVFYGRTDGTPGYKQYSTVVVRTTETDNLRYFGDLYEPHPKCDYEILFEVDMSNLPALCRKARVNEPSSVGWVKSPLKEVVLKYWKENSHSAGEPQVGISLFGVGGR